MNENRRRAIEERLAPDFNDRLLLRGRARGIIWSDGLLPDGAQRFDPELDQKLRHYAFSMLGAGIDARLENDRRLSEECFRAAAEALESAARDAKLDDPRRGYLLIIGSAAYSLARYNARAFTLLNSESLANLSDVEDDFRLFVLRDFSSLRRRFREQDQRVPDLSDKDGDTRDFLEAVFVYGTSLNYRYALISLLAYFVSGDRRDIDTVRKRLDDGIEATAEYGFVTAYWLYRLTRLIVDDSGENSYHSVLPDSPDPRLSALRGRFIRRLVARRRGQVDLWPSQIAAAPRCFDESDNLVVSLPTSAGKTRIAELAILPTLAGGRKVIYVTPLRALCAQVERVLDETFAPLGYGVSAFYALADSFGSSLTNDISVFTPDRLDYVIRRHPETLNDIGLIILDESHMIGVKKRDLRYELLIDRVTRISKRDGTRIVCLSALLPDGAEFERLVNWIRNDDETAGGLRSDWRPTRQRFGTVEVSSDTAIFKIDSAPDETSIDRFLLTKRVTGRRGIRKFPSQPWDWVIATAWRILERRDSVMIYCPRKASTIAGANRLAQVLSSGTLTGFDNQLTAVENALLDEWLPADDEVAICLRAGVVTLHADIPPPIKQIMYRLLAEQKARIIVASPAIAQGVDVAVSAVIFQSLYKSNEVIAADEFWNVAGRAGRAFADVDGQIIFVSHGKHLQDWADLTNNVGQVSFESGLSRTITRLLASIVRQHGRAVLENIEEIIERDAPPDQVDTQEQLDGIDEALLTFLEESDIRSEEAVDRLDDLVRGTFLVRTLATRSVAAQLLVKRVLTVRLRRILQYPQALRRSAYLSSTRLRLSNDFETLVAELRPLITKIESEVSRPAKSREYLLPLLLNLIGRILAFEEFKPEKPYPQASEATDFWLKGGELSKSSFGQDGLQFIESALCYQVVRAIESIRDPAIELPGILLGALISRGTISVVAFQLMQDGLRSRTAAHEIAARFSEDIVTVLEIRNTLFEHLEIARDLLAPRSLIVFDDYIDRLRRRERSRRLQEQFPAYPITMETDYSGHAWIFPDRTVCTNEMINIGAADIEAGMLIPPEGVLGFIEYGMFTPE
jgi:superfamily II DNA/RNA helicase